MSDVKALFVYYSGCCGKMRERCSMGRFQGPVKIKERVFRGRLNAAARQPEEAMKTNSVYFIY